MQNFFITVSALFSWSYPNFFHLVSWNTWLGRKVLLFLPLPAWAVLVLPAPHLGSLWLKLCEKSGFLSSLLLVWWYHLPDRPVLLEPFPFLLPFSLQRAWELIVGLGHLTSGTCMVWLSLCSPALLWVSVLFLWFLDMLFTSQRWTFCALSGLILLHGCGDLAFWLSFGVIVALFILWHAFFIVIATHSHHFLVHHLAVWCWGIMRGCVHLFRAF